MTGEIEDEKKREREREREREGSSNKTQFNRDARRDRSSLITHAYATTCKT